MRMVGMEPKEPLKCVCGFTSESSEVMRDHLRLDCPATPLPDRLAELVADEEGMNV